VIYVILGMHKSGTTLISQILHHSGINMMDEVDPDLGYDQGNKWERDSTKSINHQLLDSAGAFSLKSLKPGPRSPAADLSCRMRDVIAACSRQHIDWGFKDPRTCLTYPIWARELPPHKLIVVYRLPREGWAHYWGRAEDRRRQRVTFRDFVPRWCEYNAAALAVLQQTHMPSIVIHYTRFMQGGDEYRRLEQFVGRDLVDKREPRMNRSRAETVRFYPLARAYHRLRGGPSPEWIAEQLETQRAVSSAA
jgi:hypothetical protein